MKLTVAWQEFIPNIRIELLKQLLEIDVLYDGKTITIPDYLSSGEMEAVRFLCEPVRPVDFTVLDSNFGLKLLQIHNQFWCFFYDKRG